MASTRKETAVERAERMVRENPNVRLETSSGQGFIIPGVRPMAKEHRVEATKNEDER
jgi:hypothetical protein